MSEERALSDIVWTPERGLIESGPAPEVRGILWNNFLTNDEPYFGKSRTHAEVRVTPGTALQSTVVLACCRILAETISSLPIYVMRRTPNGGKEVAHDLPLHKVLSFAPNEWQTKFEFFEQVVMFLTLWGNSYSRIRSGRYGAVSALDNLHPSNMDVERLENGRLRYSYTNPETGRIERYTQDQIMHVRWTPEPDGIKGMVPIEIGREAIALARACEIHAAKFWANSARPGVVLQTDGSLSAEAAERLRDNWERLHRGVDKAHRTAILTNGLKVEPVGFSAEASQFESTRRFQSEEIARIYRLPMRLVQGESGGNPEIAGQEFVTYTLVPWLRRIESAISRSLIYNDDAFFAEFDTKGLMRGDSNSRAAFYSTMTGLGIYSINDCRRGEGLAPIENGDKHFVAMNMQTVEDAVKPKPDPMAAMMGAGAPPPAPGGVPSLPEVKKGEAPKEAPPGIESQKKPLKEGDSVVWDGGKTGKIAHVMAQGTLDLKSGKKVEVEPGRPVALVIDRGGVEHAVELPKLRKVQPRSLKIEKRSGDCGRQDGGKFGQGNDCAKGDGSGTDDSSSPTSKPRSGETFPEGSRKFRDAVDSVVAATGGDPEKVWDRSKGLADTPPKQQIDSIASEQGSYSGKSLTPEAEASYGSLVDEIGRQYEALVAAGLTVTPWRGEGEPYGDPPGSTKPNSNKMREEVAKTGEFKFFMTERGFGTGDATPDHPMLRETKFKTSNGEPMIANDLFRVVHDLVAHVRGGYSFSTNGEFNGMLTHASTLPESAWPALFAETFGQNAVYETTGNFAPQNAYASQQGASLIREELKRRKTQSRAAEAADSDEPLGYQHIKSRPHLMAELAKSKSESRSADCGRDPDGKFGAKNTCAGDGDGDSDSDGGSGSGSSGGSDDGSSSSGDDSGFKSSQVTEKALESIRTTGGFSIHPITTESPTTGYMVSVVPESETILDSYEGVTEEAIAKFFEQNKKQFDGRPTLHLGGWVDNSTGKVYLDLSEKFDDLDAAIDSAESTNQLAIWDLNEKKEIRKEDYNGRRKKPREARAVRLPARDVSEEHRGRPAGVREESHGREEGEGRAVEGLIAEAKRHFSSLPRIEIRSLGGPLASYSSEEDAVYVDPEACHLEESGWTSQANPVLHEIAHRTHAKSDPVSYERSLAYDFTSEQRKMIEGLVSRYAATNGREFVAEVIAGVLSGHDYSPDVMGLFYEITDDKVDL